MLVKRQTILIVALVLLILGGLGAYRYITLKISKANQQIKTAEDQSDAKEKDLPSPPIITPTTSEPSSDVPTETPKVSPKTQKTGAAPTATACYKISSDSMCLSKDVYDAITALNNVPTISDTTAPAPTINLGQ